VETRGAATGWRDAEPMVTRFKAESGRACTRHACQAFAVERAASQGSRKERKASAAVLAGLRLAADFAKPGCQDCSAQLSRQSSIVSGAI
jgi:hypothetical protein